MSTLHTINNLPSELLSRIAELAQPTSLSSLRLVSRRWCQATERPFGQTFFRFQRYAVTLAGLNRLRSVSYRFDRWIEYLDLVTPMVSSLTPLWTRERNFLAQHTFVAVGLLAHTLCLLRKTLKNVAVTESWEYDWGTEGKHLPFGMDKRIPIATSIAHLDEECKTAFGEALSWTVQLLLEAARRTRFQFANLLLPITSCSTITRKDNWRELREIELVDTTETFYYRPLEPLLHLSPIEHATNVKEISLNHIKADWIIPLFRHHGLSEVTLVGGTVISKNALLAMLQHHHETITELRMQGVILDSMDQGAWVGILKYLAEDMPKLLFLEIKDISVRDGDFLLGVKVVLPRSHAEREFQKPIRSLLAQGLEYIETGPFGDEV